MELQFTIENQGYSFQADKFFDLSLEVRPNAKDQPSCFHLPPAIASPFTSGSYTSSVDAGASVNCSVISSLCPHSNGTHTECVGHVLPGSVTLKDIVPLPTLLPAMVLTVTPVVFSSLSKEEQIRYPAGQSTDYLINGIVLEEALQKIIDEYKTTTSLSKADITGFLRNGALILRTLPNPENKRTKEYGSTNPPYLTGTASQWALDYGVQHLLIDLPSMDREDDQGLLIAHRTFWGLPCYDPTNTIPSNDETRTIVAVPSSSSSSSPSTDNPTVSSTTSSSLSRRTITEFIYVPSYINDGYYILNLQVSPIQLDAAPSRPVLFPVHRI